MLLCISDEVMLLTELVFFNGVATDGSDNQVTNRISTTDQTRQVKLPLGLQSEVSTSTSRQQIKLLNRQLPAQKPCSEFQITFRLKQLLTLSAVTQEMEAVNTSLVSQPAVYSITTSQARNLCLPTRNVQGEINLGFLPRLNLYRNPSRG